MNFNEFIGNIMDRVADRVAETDTSEGIKNKTLHIIKENGNVYEGEVLNNKKHGVGKMIYGEEKYKGHIYEGLWKNDIIHGRGKYTTSEGYVYEGDIVEGKQHGHGKATYADGGYYMGEWVDDKYHGKGKMTYADGGEYEGEYHNDKRHGKGNETFYNGDIYEGDYMEGNKHGNGKVIKNGKVLYNGSWVNNKQCNRREIDGDCAICYEKLQENYDIVWHEFGCGNAIHDKCLKEWFVKGNTESCPHCRKGWNDRCLWGTNRVPWCAL